VEIDPTPRPAADLPPQLPAQPHLAGLRGLPPLPLPDADEL